MKYLTLLLLVGFVTLAFFGSFGMHIGTQSHGGDCITGFISGVDCPRQADLLNYLSFHLNALKIFSNAVFADSLNLLALTLLLFVLAGAGALARVVLSGMAPKYSAESIRLGRLPGNLSREMRYWLSLHTNSPSLA